jgi:hypothetical protein
MKTLKNQIETKSKTNQLNFKIMKTSLLNGLICLSLILIANTNSMAQGNSNDPDVELNVNSELKSCDFNISSDLTQSEWKRFTKEAGNLLFLNPLSSAKPLGVKNWDLVIETTTSDVDETSGAWNNTFQHPDSEHYLAEGPRVSTPGLRFRIGITEKLDAGIYYTSAKPSGANYGLLGFEAKYAFINNPEKNWASSVRVSHLMDASIEDFNLSVTGIDVMASKTFFGVLTPYAGITGNWNHTKEVTDKVDLDNENYFGVRGIIGTELRWKFVNVGYEFLVGDGFNNRAMKIGVTF